MLLSSSDVKRIYKAVRFVETMMRGGEQAPAQTSVPQFADVQMVRATGEESNNGRWPAKLQDYDTTENTWSDGEDAWLADPNGNDVVAGIYLARSWDVWAGGPVYTPALFAGGTVGGDTIFEGDVTFEGDTTVEGDLVIQGDTNLTNLTIVNELIFSFESVTLISATSVDIAVLNVGVYYFDFSIDISLYSLMIFELLDVAFFFTIYNVSTSHYLILKHDDGSTGTASMRFLNTGGIDLKIPPGGNVRAMYDPNANRIRTGGALPLSYLQGALDTLPYYDSATTASTTPLTSFARTILDDVNAAAVRATIGAGTGSGSVTSVALAVPSFLSVAGSPIVGAGTLTVTLATEIANTFFAGPTVGGDAAPTFRAIVNADYPADTLTAGKMHASATDVLFGRSTAGAGGGEEITCTAFARTILDDASASVARTTLALGTMATQNSNAVGISGGTITGSTVTSLVGLGIRSTGAAFNLTFASSEVLTAGRTLTIVMGDAARTLTFTANATIGGTSSGTNTGDVTLAGETYISISSQVITAAKITEAQQNLTDVTTANASTSAHGYLKKLDNTATHYMDGTGAWSTPTGNASTITVADAASDTTCWIAMFGSATGDLAPLTDGGLTYNATTDALTATTFIGALTGNASTATALATARAINGTNFDGTAAITVTAAAGTLTGATLAAGVTASSLTSLGTIASIVVSAGTIAGLTALAVRDTSAAFDLTIAGTSSTALTAGRTLTIDVVNAARTLKLAGNLTASAAATVSGTNTGDVTLAGETFITIAGQVITGVKVTEAQQNLTDVTTANCSTSAHGYLKKLSNVSTEYMSGTGVWSTPAGGSGTVTSVSVVTANGVSGSVATATATPAITLTLGDIVPTSVAATGTGSFILSDAGTNSATAVLTTGHNTSGTAAAGFGSIRKWQLQSSTTASQDAADITVTWATATHASRKARIVVDVFDTATREVLRGEASGSAPMIGFLGASASARLVSPDLGTLATTFGLASGTPTFDAGNLSGTIAAGRMPAFTGDVTSAAGAVGLTIAADAVTYAKMQNVSATSRILGRKTASAGDAEECTLSEVLDFIGSAAQGDILYRGSSGWARLAAGTSGYFLKTQGASANVMWDAASSSLSVVAPTLLYGNTAVSSAIANTTVDTAFSLSYTLPANSVLAGDVIRLFASGSYATTGIVNLTIKVKVGSTTVWTSGALGPVPTGTEPWRLAVQLGVLSVGSSGSWEVSGAAQLYTSATGLTEVSAVGAASTINTTTTEAITVTATWSVANAANTITMRQLSIEKLTPLVTTGGGGAADPGVAKAWCIFTTVTTSSITASYGVSSIVDNGTGDTTINWSTPFSSTDYPVVYSAGNESSGVAISGLPVAARSASSMRCQIRNGANTATDYAYNSVVAFGSQ